MLNKAIKWSALFAVTGLAIAVLNYWIFGVEIGDGWVAWIDEAFTAGFVFWGVITITLSLVWVVRALVRGGDFWTFFPIYLAVDSLTDSN